MESKIISISKIKSFEDTRPLLCRLTWKGFVESCRVPVVRGLLSLDQYLSAEKIIRDRQKDGAAIIAGTYSRLGTRKQDYLESLSLVTLDLDDSPFSFDELCDRLNCFEAVVFTSYSHSKKVPKYRAYLPLLRVITGSLKTTLGGIIDYFDEHVGHLDPVCRNPGQLFYSPACPPGGESLYQARHLSGVLLDPADFPSIPTTPALRPPNAQEQGTSERFAISTKPGDIYNARASWSDLLEPLGWTHCYRTHWTRPGKKFGVSGSVLDSGFYVHSSAPATAPFVCGKTYSLFGAYTLIHHGGDYSAAARELRRQNSAMR